MQDYKIDPAAGDKAYAPFRKRRQLERDLDHITQEMYRRNRELAETNKTLSLLRSIDALILDSHESLQTVCNRICQAIGDAVEYPFVGIFTRSPHLEGEMLLRGWSLHSSLMQRPLELSKPMHVKLQHSWFSTLEHSKLVSLGAISAEEMLQHTNYSLADIQHLQKRLPIQSLYVVKLMARRKLVGLITIGYTSAADELNEAATAFIDHISESVGVALDNKLLFEENQHVLRQLRETNAKLRALDETKDDFISMASHQLRTPLTSVKGYLSMVIEGDTGKINKLQKEMLTQAFTSSQRMVYLIADLLNVSRLKTGKFIIQPNTVDLATMVKEELDQLKETAASRSVTLDYEKPKDFPQIVLDETKTRQVIMNFADNAIYYTPAGGHIVVSLVDKPHGVELRIKDDGIGVPKNEQPHLFTKFYRAGNARKARPDGTGLGLFMAKKVIIAQGGSLIFESKEGAGSTFGFSFSKNAATLPPSLPPEVATPQSKPAPKKPKVSKPKKITKPVAKSRPRAKKTANA